MTKRETKVIRFSAVVELLPYSPPFAAVRQDSKIEQNTIISQKQLQQLLLTLSTYVQLIIKLFYFIHHQKHRNCSNIHKGQT